MRITRCQGAEEPCSNADIDSSYITKCVQVRMLDVTCKIKYSSQALVLSPSCNYQYKRLWFNMIGGFGNNYFRNQFDQSIKINWSMIMENEFC